MSHLINQSKIISLPVTRISIEFFPPRSPEAGEKLTHEADILISALNPEFISVTYGAGGTTRQATLQQVMGFYQKHHAKGPDVAAHITVAGASRHELKQLLDQYWQMGIRRLVVLRGDAEQGQDRFTAHPQGFQYAAELVEMITQEYDHGFDVAVGCYPETHPEAISAHDDLLNLKRKMELGAKSALSQFFFDADAFLRFRDQAIKMGIHIPIVPGILPFVSVAQTFKFADLCQTKIPPSLQLKMEKISHDNTGVQELGVETAGEIMERLFNQGVRDFHLYSLNRSSSVMALLKNHSHIFSQQFISSIEPTTSNMAA